MDQLQPEQEDGGKKGQWFAATHWSVVLAAGHASPQQRAQALETLCRIYWQPLYTYIRRLGSDVADAQDLTQGFFAHLLGGNCLQTVSPAKGKFRSFLLATLKNFLADERDRAAAAKRGGGQILLGFDPNLGEDHFQQESSPDRSAECLFDRRWALTLLDLAFRRLEEEFALGGRAGQFAELSAYLGREGKAADYEAVAAKLGMKPGTVAVAVHRLRLRYRELIRAEIAHTVPDAADVDEEMRYLLEVICQ